MPPSRRTLYTISQLIKAMLLVTAIIVPSIIAVMQWEYGQDLEYQVKERDAELRDIAARDSIFVSKNKEYSEVITKYVDECNLVINGKKVSTPEIVKYMNDLSNENYTLRDSLYNLLNRVEIETSEKKLIGYKYVDSVSVLNKILDLIDERYGIRYTIRNDGKHRYLSPGVVNKADSGLMLLGHYRDQIKKDSVGDYWVTFPVKNKK